jgi:hypothetical protein
VLLSFIASVLSVAVVVAQGDVCPPSVFETLKAVGENCNGLGRNTACYGNNSIVAEAQPDVTDFAFSQDGDIAPLNSIQSLTTAPLNLETNEWGIAILSVQANLPDTLPGQNVTMVVFGDATLEPQVTLTLPITGNGANIRQEPSTSGAVVGSLPAGTTLKADGRLEDNSWVRVVLDDGTVGWINTGVSTVEGDISSLKVRTAEDVSVSSGASAFYFNGGVGSSACSAVPSEGLVIQTPSDAGAVELNINNVGLSVGSTIFIQSRPNDFMTIATLEGNVRATSADKTVSIPAGVTAQIPTDADGLANGEPVLVEDITDISALFTNSEVFLPLLPETIEIAQAIKASEIPAVALEEAAYPTVPLAGYWQATLTENIADPDCKCKASIPVDYQTTILVEVSTDRQSVVLSGDSWLDVSVQQTVLGEYVQSIDNDDYEVSIISPRDMRLSRKGVGELVWQLTYLGTETPTAIPGPLTPGKWSFTPTGENEETCLQSFSDFGDNRLQVSKTGYPQIGGFVMPAGADEGNYRVDFFDDSVDIQIDTPTKLTGTIVDEECTITFEGTLLRPSFSALVDSLPPVDDTIIPLSGEWTSTLTVVDVDETCGTVTQQAGNQMVISLEVSQDGQQMTLKFGEANVEVIRQPNGYYYGIGDKGEVYLVYEVSASDSIREIFGADCFRLESDITLNP